MSSNYVIRGVPVTFPFPPYDVQTAYMEKVIECLEDGKNGVLESPTGTGKTLSLLCSSLAWLTIKKNEYEAEVLRLKNHLMANKGEPTEDLLKSFCKLKGSNEDTTYGTPKIIYASRTHSQISQAMQELRRSGYGHMKSAVIGSRDQLCINSEVMKEPTNATKTAACKAKMRKKNCTYHLQVESQRSHPDFTEQPVLDIEDLIRIGTKHTVCPFFVAKDRAETADIVFMPYNYLLDPKTRSANNINLYNTIVILDEAHNVEKLCEDSASMQLRSSDVATAISDVTAAMKHLDDMEKGGSGYDFSDASKDFSLEDLANLKEMLLVLEQEIDNIVVTNVKEGTTYSGDFIFELLQGAKITDENYHSTVALVDSLVLFLVVIAESTAFGKKGFGLQKLNDLLTIVFAECDIDYRQRVTKCYRVHVEIEETPKQGPKVKEGWLSTKLMTSTKSKVVSYWCFSPSFAMRRLLKQQTRCIIMTSGTLAPMKPLISEMDIPVSVQLENPHIVSTEQVLVKVISQGPDKEPLLSNYNNRNNPKYLQSLGRTILSFCPLIPDGLLVFFPSYPILETCQKAWQESGIWSSIQRIKPIFVEPRNKNAFVTTMADYYAEIKNPASRGAVFMAVCRGKVSEGLDFINENGRAVIITGLPFPPLKDPRVILKKQYLEESRTEDNQLMSGDEWYVLEAARAINQAIGRVIRHRYDYGAILLCDSRFSYPRQQKQLSKWIQGHLKAIDFHQQRNLTFGRFIGDLNRFFRNAQKTLPKSENSAAPIESQHIKVETAGSSRMGFDSLLRAAQSMPTTIDLTQSPAKETKSQVLFSSYSSQSQSERGDTKDFLTRLDSTSKTIDFNRLLPKIEATSQDNPGDASQSQTGRKRKFKLIDNAQPPPKLAESKNVAIKEEEELPQDKFEMIKMVKKRLHRDSYALLLRTVATYNESLKLTEFVTDLCTVFESPELHFMLKGMRRYVRDHQREEFDRHLVLKHIS